MNEKAKILVIEDNTDNLTTVKALLEENYIFVSATDGIEGIRKAQELEPGLILLDISLPGMDGYKTLEELKKIDKLLRTPVIALTARAMKGDREDLLTFGFDGYISKPIDNKLFEHVINEWLSKKE